jgi:hypothetical protein
MLLTSVRRIADHDMPQTCASQEPDANLPLSLNALRSPPCSEPLAQLVL